MLVEIWIKILVRKFQDGRLSLSLASLAGGMPRPASFIFKGHINYGRGGGDMLMG